VNNLGITKSTIESTEFYSKLNVPVEDVDQNKVKILSSIKKPQAKREGSIEKSKVLI
jgi:hypothetical protein